MPQTFYTAKLLPKARSLRRAATPAERKLWHEGLKCLPWRFRRQRPFGDYIVDFYCAEARLVVELDGESHDDADAQAPDEKRTSFLEMLGLTVVRFNNVDVMTNLEGVVTQLRALIEGATPLSAPQTSPLHAGETRLEQAFPLPPLRAGEAAPKATEGSRTQPRSPPQVNGVCK